MKLTALTIAIFLLSVISSTAQHSHPTIAMAPPAPQNLLTYTSADQKEFVENLLILPAYDRNAAIRKRNGFIKIGLGVAAIAFGAVTYSMLNKDYQDYKNYISNPEKMSSYASPGPYVSAGAAAVGLGISLSAITNFKKR